MILDVLDLGPIWMLYPHLHPYTGIIHEQIERSELLHDALDHGPYFPVQRNISLESHGVAALIVDQVNRFLKPCLFLSFVVTCFYKTTGMIVLKG